MSLSDCRCMNTPVEFCCITVARIQGSLTETSAQALAASARAARAKAMRFMGSMARGASNVRATPEARALRPAAGADALARKNCRRRNPRCRGIAPGDRTRRFRLLRGQALVRSGQRLQRDLRIG